MNLGSALRLSRRVNGIGGGSRRDLPRPMGRGQDYTPGLNGAGYISTRQTCFLPRRYLKQESASVGFGGEQVITVIKSQVDSLSD